MEVPSLQGLGIEHGLLTKERRQRLGEKHRSLRIAIPREVSNEERRVSVAPAGVRTLVANGHEVFVGAGAGEHAHFSDHRCSRRARRL